MLGARKRGKGGNGVEGFFGGGLFNREEIIFEKRSFWTCLRYPLSSPPRNPSHAPSSSTRDKRLIAHAK